MKEVSLQLQHECRTASRRQSGNAGFLLIEALTAMAIGALLLVALASSVSLVIRASHSVSRSDKAVEETTSIVNALVREIGTISPLRWMGTGGGLVFEGSESRLVFAHTVHRPDGMTDTELVTLDSRGAGLRQQDQALPPDATGQAMVSAAGTQGVLDTRFIVRFAYFGSQRDGRETLTDAWTDPNMLPVAVRVTLTDGGGATRGVVRIPILVNAEPGCAAPGLAVCSFVPVDALNAAESAVAWSPPVDADDALGWERYLGQ